MQYSEEVLRKAKIAVKVGNAILEGKEIEFENSDGVWKLAVNVTLNFDLFKYRVKPEPKYIPFTFEDAKDLIGKAVVSVTYGNIAIIDKINSLTVEVFTRISYEQLLTDFTFLDGSPCGKIQNT